MHPRWPLVVVSAILLSCTRRDAERPAPPADAPAPTRAWEAPAPAGKPRADAAPRRCNAAEIPLRVSWFEERSIGAFVPVVKDGRAALLQLDTGAALTHFTHDLAGPELIPSAGVVVLGCQTRRLDSWRQRPIAGVDGLEVVGSVGADLFLGGVTELDLRKSVVRLFDELPPETRAWPSTGFEVRDGVILVSAEADGFPVRLLFDTGADALLLLTAGIDDRVAVVSTDAFGNELRLVWGSASLVWGGSREPMKVTAWRTRSLPAFEQQARSWGGVHGLLGLSAFGARRVVFDGKRHRLYVAPR